MATRKASVKENAAHRKLAEELVSLIPALDEAGLEFLVEQARVHLYNMEIEREEAEAAEAERAATAEAERAVGSKGKKVRSGGKSGNGTKAATGPANFRIERSSSGTTWHIISGGKWKMYNEEEMLSIVRIAQSKDPLPEVSKRLADWFDEERPDTWGDLEIDGLHDQKLKELILFLRKKFAVRTK
jgi:hypothetical protein